MDAHPQYAKSEVLGDGSKPWYLVNPKIAGKWMFIPLKMVLIGIDPYPFIPQWLLVVRVHSYIPKKTWEVMGFCHKSAIAKFQVASHEQPQRIPKN